MSKYVVSRRMLVLASLWLLLATQTTAMAAPRCLVRFAFDDKAGMDGPVFDASTGLLDDARAAQLLTWVKKVDAKAQGTLLGRRGGAGPLGAVWNGYNDLVILCERSAKRVTFGKVKATSFGQADAWWVYAVPYAKWHAALRMQRVRRDLVLGVATIRISGTSLGLFRETGGE